MAIPSIGEASFLLFGCSKTESTKRSNSLNRAILISTAPMASLFREDLYCSNSLSRVILISTVYFHKPLPSSLSDPILARNFLNILIFPHQKHRQRYHEKHRFNSLKRGSFFSMCVFPPLSGKESNVTIPSNGQFSFLLATEKDNTIVLYCGNSLKRAILISTVYSHKPLNSRLSKLIFACNFLNILILAYLWLFLCFFKNCINIRTIPSLNMPLFIRLRLLLQWQFP